MKQQRKPQINFQVETPMKLLYEEAKANALSVTRFCAAGLLLMVEDASARQAAIDRLREWEAQYEDATADEIRSFVQAAQAAMRTGARGTPPARPVRPSQRKAKRT